MSKLLNACKEHLNSKIEKLSNDYKHEIISTYREFLEKQKCFKEMLNRIFIKEFKTFPIYVNYNAEEKCIDSILFYVDSSMKGENKYFYKLNNNLFHSNLIPVNNIDDEINYYQHNVEVCNDYYNEIPGLKEKHILYIELLKIKKDNPYVDFYFK